MRINMTELKRKAPSIIESLSEEVIITKKGRPVAKLVPLTQESQSKPVPGLLKDTLIEMGDIISPMDEAWEADHE